MRRSTKVEEIRYRGAAEVQTDPFIFRGSVSGAGYEWLDGLDGRPRLVPMREAGVGTRPCEPHPGLFRDFAELNPTRDGILSFAKRYGDLFSRYDAEQSAVRSDGTVAWGSSLGTWEKEIADMRALVDLWDKIKTQQFAELRKIIQHTDKWIAYEIATPRRESWQILAHADLGRGLDVFDPEDVLLPARCALQMEINKRLAEAPTVPRLAWTPDRPQRYQRLIFEPSTLLAAMWIQFAQDMTGKFGLVKCVCGDYFQVGPGAKKGNARTCGPRCRQRKSRDTQRPVIRTPPDKKST